MTYELLYSVSGSLCLGYGTSMAESSSLFTPPSNKLRPLAGKSLRLGM